MYITDMYEAYCTYVDDKYFGNHDYDDDTDADTDNDTGDDTGDDISTPIIMRSVSIIDRSYGAPFFLAGRAHRDLSARGLPGAIGWI